MQAKFKPTETKESVHTNGKMWDHRHVILRIHIRVAAKPNHLSTLDLDDAEMEKSMFNLSPFSRDAEAGAKYHFYAEDDS